MKLVVDMRKAFDAGIGTYIRNVVPKVLTRLDPSVEVTALTMRSDVERIGLLPIGTAQIAPMHAAPFSVAEQLELRSRVPGEALFWATSLAHPLGRRGAAAFTVHDLVQLALTPRDGVPRATALAVRAYFASLHRCEGTVLAVSAFTRDEYVRRLGAPVNQRLVVTPLGVDEAWFDARVPSPKRSSYFVCVGSIRPHKNIERLLYAFAQVSDRLAHDLKIVGAVGRSREYEAWLDRLPATVRARVSFTGRIEDVDLRPLVARAEALVFPSLYEGFGLPALEAMAAGCPVIASRAGALPEVCASVASYFEPRNTEELSSRLLEHAALNDMQRAERVMSGVAHARSYSWQRTADLTASALRDCLSAEPARARR